MDFQILALIEGLADMGWVLKNYGPLVGTILFFIWRDYRREDKLSTRVTELEEEQREVILPLVKDCSAVIATNTQVMEQNTKVMERLEHVIDRTLNQ